MTFGLSKAVNVMKSQAISELKLKSTAPTSSVKSYKAKILRHFRSILKLLLSEKWSLLVQFYVENRELEIGCQSSLLCRQPLT